MRIGCAALYLSLLVTASCATHANPPVANLSKQDAQATMDCGTTSFYDEREACYARWPINACSRNRECPVYVDMRRTELQRQELEKRLVDLAREAYGGYGENDPAYVGDMARKFAQGSTAWRAYRDAHCEAEPLLQGMSRTESSALTELCRLDLTKLRIKQVEVLLKAL